MDSASRIAMTKSCRDADAIPKVPEAGCVIGSGDDAVQVMHNGLRVAAGAYHGDWMIEIIRGLRGHHEPQEELLFSHLLAHARHGTLIVELASFWAYYALWYLRSVPGSQALCIEPDPVHMAAGRRNAEQNRAAERIRFIEAWVGGEAMESCIQVCESTGRPRALPRFDMNSLSNEIGQRPIELLHMDAQGAELSFLQTMRPITEAGMLRFAMISTHHSSISGSASTHADCLAAIRDLDGAILAEFDVTESFSGDGLIVASFIGADRRLEMPTISRNRAELSLFRGK